MNLGVLVCTEVDSNGSFDVKLWQLVTLLHFDVQQDWIGVSSESPSGRWWFLVLRFPFLPWRIKGVSTLKLTVLQFRTAWCFPVIMWFKKPGGSWRRQKAEWSPYPWAY